MLDLDAYLLDLLHPAQVGEELFPGVTLVRVSSESGWRLTVDAGGVEVLLEVEPLDPARPSAVSTARLAVSYGIGRTGPPVDPQLGYRLCRALAHRMRARENAVLARLARDAAEARSMDEGGTRIREVRITRLLEPMGTAQERFYGLNPYAGCLIGCRFCYAQTRMRAVRRLQLLQDVPWGSYVDVRINAAEVLSRELAEHDVQAIKFCPILSDPYHVVEQRYGITRACLTVLRDTRPAPLTLVLTRSALITRDAELLAAIPGAFAGVSLPTIDDAARLHFEPRGASITARLDALRALRSAGVRTFAIVQPMLPGSLDALTDALADTVGSVRIDVLHGVEGAGAEFADPRYAYAATDAWQRERALALAEALRTRGVRVWDSELPPEELRSRAS